ncbi:MAG: hypothetical protein ABSF32_08145 [Ignavibacteria bacterium]
MKKIIILFYLTSIIIQCKADNLEKYRTAFNYITRDTINLNNWFKESFGYDTLPHICVSDHVIYIGYLFWMNDIIKYEMHYYDTTYRRTLFIDSVADSLDSLNDFPDYRDNRLLTLNNGICKGFIIFFSKVERGNKLKAVIVPYEEGINECKNPYLEVLRGILLPLL